MTKFMTDTPSDMEISTYLRQKSLESAILRAFPCFFVPKIDKEI